MDIQVTFEDGTTELRSGAMPTRHWNTEHHLVFGGEDGKLLPWTEDNWRAALYYASTHSAHRCGRGRDVLAWRITGQEIASRALFGEWQACRIESVNEQIARLTRERDEALALLRNDGAREVGIQAGEVDHHGELELVLEVDGRKGSVWVSEATWQAWGEHAGWDSAAQEALLVHQTREASIHEMLTPLDIADGDAEDRVQDAVDELRELRERLEKGGPRVCVAAIVTDRKGRLALVRTKRGWELPGGKVQLGEHWRRALAREMREELGADVRWFEENPIVFDGMPVNGAQYQSVIIIARGKLLGDAPPIAPVAGDSVIEARWFAREEVPLDELSKIASEQLVLGLVATGISEAPGLFESAWALFRAARSWVSEARLLGNIRAIDIANVAQAAMMMGGLTEAETWAKRVEWLEEQLKAADQALIERGIENNGEPLAERLGQLCRREAASVTKLRRAVGLLTAQRPVAQRLEQHTDNAMDAFEAGELEQALDISMAELRWVIGALGPPGCVECGAPLYVRSAQLDVRIRTLREQRGSKMLEIDVCSVHALARIEKALAEPEKPDIRTEEERERDDRSALPDMIETHDYRQPEGKT